MEQKIRINRKLEAAGLRPAVEAILERWPFLADIAVTSAQGFAFNATRLPIAEVCIPQCVRKLEMIACERDVRYVSAREAIRLARRRKNAKKEGNSMKEYEVLVACKTADGYEWKPAYTSSMAALVACVDEMSDAGLIAEVGDTLSVYSGVAPDGVRVWRLEHGSGGTMIELPRDEDISAVFPMSAWWDEEWDTQADFSDDTDPDDD